MKNQMILLVLLLGACGANNVEEGSRADRIVAEIHNPVSRRVLVVAHRGDWRNYPENSIGAIESVIRMGADVMELVLKKTSVGVLVLMHDG